MAPCRNRLNMFVCKAAHVGCEWPATNLMSIHVAALAINISIDVPYFSLQVGKEVQRRLVFWQSRLREMEEKYLEFVEKVGTSASIARRNKEGKKD